VERNSIYADSATQSGAENIDKAKLARINHLPVATKA
jgi:hypothetical protein